MTRPGSSTIMWGSRIVQRIRVFGNIEAFLNYRPGVGQERPVCANSAAKLISLNNTVGGDCHQFAVRNLELTVELNESLMLPTLLWTETPAPKDKNHYPHYRFAGDQIGQTPRF